MPPYANFLRFLFFFFFQVRDHILSFPSQESHYSRTKHAGKQYLDEKLSVQRMYFMYLQEEEPEVWFARANALR